MDEAVLLARIQRQPHVLGGRPTVRGLRVTADHVINLLASGQTPEQIVSDFPELERADIDACLAYARTVLQAVIDHLSETKATVDEIGRQFKDVDGRVLTAVLRLAAHSAEIDMNHRSSSAA